MQVYCVIFLKSPSFAFYNNTCVIIYQCKLTLQYCQDYHQTETYAFFFYWTTASVLLLELGCVCWYKVMSLFLNDVMYSFWMTKYSPTLCCFEGFWYVYQKYFNDCVLVHDASVLSNLWSEAMLSSHHAVLPLLCCHHAITLRTVVSIWSTVILLDM